MTNILSTRFIKYNTNNDEPRILITGYKKEVLQIVLSMDPKEYPNINKKECSLLINDKSYQLAYKNDLEEIVILDILPIQEAHIANYETIISTLLQMDKLKVSEIRKIVFSIKTDPLRVDDWFAAMYRLFGYYDPDYVIEFPKCPNCNSTMGFEYGSICCPSCGFDPSNLYNQ